MSDGNGGSRSVLVAGAINTDLVARVRTAPEAGETVTGSSFATFGGGKGANQAVAAARSGAAVRMLGALGDDNFGTQRMSDLAAEGIDTAHVAIDKNEASGVALILVDDNGQNRIAYVPGATLTVGIDQARRALATDQPAVLLSTLELPIPVLRELFSEARRRGVRVVFNATPEPASGRDLLDQVDVLIVNENEAIELLDRSVAAGDWEVAARALRELGPDGVVITLGAAGAIVCDGERAETVPTQHVDVVDTTGAGDAFCGAFAAQVAGGASLFEAAKIGVMAGSLATTKAGAQPSMPAWREIESARGAGASRPI